MPEQVPLYVCPNCKTRIPFGTRTQEPATHCPGCERRLWIPRVIDEIPPEWQRSPDRPGGGFMSDEPNPYAAPLSRLDRMTERVPRVEYPWWVKLSMWGVPSRVGLWAFVALSVASAAGCVVYGFWDQRFFLGVSFLFSALMYWLSIRWVDRHGSWASDA